MQPETSFAEPPRYTIPSLRSLFVHSLVAATVIALLMLVPLLVSGFSWYVVMITFGSSYSVSIASMLFVHTLLRWSMPLAKRRKWPPLRGWSVAMITGSIISNLIYAFVYALWITNAQMFWQSFLLWILVGGVITGILLVVFWSLERLQRELARGRQAVVSHALLSQELAMARLIQTRLLPTEAPQMAGLDVAGACLPAREVGGDLLNYQLLGPGLFSLSIGDVTGKSISAAMLMGVTLGALQAEIHDHQQPALVLQEIDRWLRVQQQKNVFVALSTALIDTKERLLTLANAGQLMPLLLRKGHVQYVETPIGLPLGIGPPADIIQERLQLRSHDVLFFYTDGIVEAQNTAGVLWGFEAFLDVLRQLEPGTSAAAIRDTILHHISTFTNQYDQHDDITIIVVRIL